MSFANRRFYAGPVRALVTDLAGTVVDHGSCAPAGAFVELFRREGVEITDAQARGPMGLQKKDHIRVLAQLPEVAARWREAHGRACSEEDVDRMYEAFVPLQLEVLPRYCELIPGVTGAVATLRERGVRVAATTGYNREMMETVLAHVRPAGFEPEVAVCASDVPSGRPAPWMNLRCLQAFDVYPPEAAVTIGDTVPDIEAGLNAGMWSVGVVRTGNMLGLDEAGTAALPAPELEARLEAGRRRLREAGAHFVVDGFDGCIAVLDEIGRLLASGARP